MRKRVWGLPGAVAAALLPGVAVAQSSAKCDELTIKVTAAGDQECDQRKLGGGDGTAVSESVRILGAGSIFVVSHTYAGVRTYLFRQEIKDFVAHIEAFQAVEDWSDERRSGDFAVRTFRATVRGEGRSIPCFGFSRFSGHVPNTGSGYRHHIFGFYCDFLAHEVGAGRVDAMVASVTYDFE